MISSIKNNFTLPFTTNKAIESKYCRTKPGGKQFQAHLSLNNYCLQHHSAIAQYLRYSKSYKEYTCNVNTFDCIFYNGCIRYKIKPPIKTGIFSNIRIGFVITNAKIEIQSVHAIVMIIPFLIAVAVPFSSFAPKNCDTTLPEPTAITNEFH